MSLRPRPEFEGAIRENFPNGDMVIVGDLVEYPPELEGVRNQALIDSLGLIFPDWITHFKYGQTKNGFLMSEFREDSFLSVVADEKPVFDEGVLITTYSIKGELTTRPRGIIEDDLILHFDFRGRSNTDADRTTYIEEGPEKRTLEVSHFIFNETYGWKPEGLSFSREMPNYVYWPPQGGTFEKGTLSTYIKPRELGNLGGYLPSILSNFSDFQAPSRGFSVVLLEGNLSLLYGTLDNWELISTGHSINVNEWTHVSVTYESNHFLVYANGQEILSHNTTVPMAYSPNFFVIGSASNDTPTYPLNGIVASAQAYSRVLTAEEIQNNYDYERSR